jgi:hypothetical protein
LFEADLRLIEPHHCGQNLMEHWLNAGRRSGSVAGGQREAITHRLQNSRLILERRQAFRRSTRHGISFSFVANARFTLRSVTSRTPPGFAKDRGSLDRVE